MGKKKVRSKATITGKWRKRQKRAKQKLPLNKNSYRMWDKRAAPLQQYSLLGIESNPNRTLKRDKIRHEISLSNIKPEISRDRKLTDFLPLRKVILTRRQIKRQTKKDVFRRLEKLIRKYGDGNYEDMSFDNRINFLQDTAKKLEKKILWMKKVEYNRKLLAMCLYQEDYEKMKEDIILNWRGKSDMEMKEEIEGFLQGEITEEHKELVESCKKK